MLIQVAIVVVIVVAFLALVRLFPMSPTIQRAISIVVGAGLALWILIVVVPFLWNLASHSAHHLK